MAGISTCVGMRRISAFGVSPDEQSHSLLTCSMSTPVGRNGLHVRHLGSSHSLKCRSLISSRSDRLRPAVPRQGRLLCQAAKQEARVSLGTELSTDILRKLPISVYMCNAAEPVQTSTRDGWSAKGISGPARGSVLWSCTASHYSCWSTGVHRRVTRPR